MGTFHYSLTCTFEDGSKLNHCGSDGIRCGRRPSEEGFNANTPYSQLSILEEYEGWLPRELRIKRVVRRRLGLAVAAAAQPMDLQRQIRISSDKPFAVGGTLYGIHPVSSDF
ncbi:hypothetical protein V3C99_017912 [Haemonchus contortus]